MSQKKGNAQKKGNTQKTATEKRKQAQRRKSMKNMLWILAGCIVLGLGAGFIAGKYWIYPAYLEKTGRDYQQEQQSQSEINNQELLDLNRQIEEADTEE